MERTPQDVTEAELQVLQVLWDRAPATIRQITDTLYPDPTDANYSTVQKLLERMEQKGHVARDRNAHRHQFSAVTSREALVGRRLRALAEQLADGTVASLLTHLVRAETLSSAELGEIRDLIDQLGRKGKSADRR
jgi:BlaI family transcriptional regulator, penicillinase repressor